MNKALIIGGSNGIGYAIGLEILEKGYIPIVLDIVKPKYDCEFFYFDMTNLNDALLRKLVEDKDIKILMITAGIGRVCSFENLHLGEIEKIMRIDAESSIKVIKYFYPRIHSNDEFYTGIMGSIAGLLSSPLFSVYSAAKAAICKFVESVNIELEVSGIDNRILNISPGSIKGTKFNGGENDLSLTCDLAEKIIVKLLNKETLYIPNYDAVFKGVIENYQKNPHDYGIHSYEFKTSSGRLKDVKQAKIGYMSGTFDLFHVGHLNIIKKAKENCDYLIVGVHKDVSHKGKQVFIPFEERIEIVKACRYVDRVVPSMKEDSDAVFKYGANILFVGSDYKGTERFNNYEKLFEGKNIKIMYFPYTKGVSSSQIRERISLKNKK